MLVKEVMNPGLVSISPEESAALAARLLTRHNLGALPVCGPGGRLEGVLTDRDIVTRCVAAGEDPAAVPVERIMTRGPVCAAPEEEALAALAKMARRQVRRLPVVSQGRVVGMVSLGDLSRRRGDWGMEAAAALAEISGGVRSAEPL